MTDYVGVALQGFSTGLGVIFAHELWNWFKRHRKKLKIIESIENIFEEDDMDEVLK